MTPDIARAIRAYTQRIHTARAAYYHETTCPHCGGDTTPTPFREPRVCPSCKENEK